MGGRFGRRAEVVNCEYRVITRRPVAPTKRVRHSTESYNAYRAELVKLGKRDTRFGPGLWFSGSVSGIVR
jgi:hypothetical protein